MAFSGGCLYLYLFSLECLILSAPGSECCLFDLRLCSKGEICVQDGLFGQCRERSERDVTQFQVTPGTLQQLQGILRQLTAKGLSWRDDMTLEPLDVLDEDRSSLSHGAGRAVQRFTGAGQPAAQRWSNSVDKLQYFRPHLPSPQSDSAHQQQRRPAVSMKQDMSPLVERYLTYFMLGSQTPKSQFAYQDPSRMRSPARVFGATYTRPDGSRRLIYGKYQGGQEGPLTVHVPKDRFNSWSELRRKLPRQSLDNKMTEDPVNSSEELLDGINQITDSDQELQEDGRAEALRALRGSLGMQSIADAQTDAQGLGDAVSLAGILEKYGVDLRQLSEPQLQQLSSLLQLIQMDSLQSQGARYADKVPPKRVAEGDMQHMVETEPQFPPPSCNPKARIAPMPASRRTPSNGTWMGEAQPARQLPPSALAWNPACRRRQSNTRVCWRPSMKREEQRRWRGTDTRRTRFTTMFPSKAPSKLRMKLDTSRQTIKALQSDLESETGMKIVQTGVGKVGNGTVFPHASHFGDNLRFVLLIFIALACIAGIVIASAVIFCIRQHAKQREKERLAGLGPEGSGDSTFEYQDLCRQHMAGKALFNRTETASAAAENSRVSSVSSQFSDVPQPSPSSHSSTPSWCEEPVQSNMDISTGHMILAYMEDHLRNRDRLAKEWQALGGYQAEPNACSIAKTDTNLKKNRNPDFVPYDHARIKLKSENNTSHSDYINASPVIEHDPRMPAYIATQGPLSHTIADFWQMVWENGCTVIVMLSPLVEDGVKQCDRYWPDEGSSLYHIYEVNLVSEHIWCEDFLVRSFYLKNVQSQETRTLTQFHFLSWPAEGIPSSTRPLLDFRRKVNKSFRGRSCPIIAHCSDGAGRTGTYILIDMVLNRMAKGVKEIDIAASLEHVRDQRPGMVRTKDQFEFALTAVAEEVNAILKALPQ
uniref:Protein tyrosine phosphatase receptor type N n=1 Tax=Leptobrachium leishanense TaxID=445787 RepID=A0A8C5QQD0_9ANUR